MKIETKTIVKIGVGIFLLYLAIYYWNTVSDLFFAAIGAASPLIIGALIAYLVNILMTFFERHYFPKSSKPAVVKSRRAVCLTAAILAMLFIVATVCYLIIPELWASVVLIIARLPGQIESLLEYANELEFIPDNIIDILENIDWKSRIEQIVSVFTTGLGNVVNTVIKTLSSVFSGIVTALIAIIFAMYLLIGRDKLLRQSHRLLKHYLRPRVCEKLFYVLHIVNDSFRRFIVGQCTEAVILGILCTVGMMIFRFPYATMIGALVAFTALIPIAGAYIGAGVGAFMILTVSPIKALLFLVFIIVLQQIEGNAIYPRVVGSSIGLPGVWVLAAVTIGGGVMGIPGMLIGVPLTASLYRIIRNDINHTSSTEET